MDYMVGKTAKRIELRVLAKLFRTIFDLPASGSVDPILLLDKLHDTELFSDVDYEVVYNNALGKTVPAQCVITDTGYLIQIKESTYNGAYEKGTGGNRMHIMHEIVHHSHGTGGRDNDALRRNERAIHKRAYAKLRCIRSRRKKTNKLLKLKFFDRKRR